MPVAEPFLNEIMTRWYRRDVPPPAQRAEIGHIANPPVFSLERQSPSFALGSHGAENRRGRADIRGDLRPDNHAGDISGALGVASLVHPQRQPSSRLFCRPLRKWSVGKSGRQLFYRLATGWRGRAVLAALPPARFRVRFITQANHPPRSRAPIIHVPAWLGRLPAIAE